MEEGLSWAGLGWAGLDRVWHGLGCVQDGGTRKGCMRLNLAVSQPDMDNRRGAVTGVVL